MRVMNLNLCETAWHNIQEELMMGAVISEMPVSICQTTWSNIPEELFIFITMRTSEFIVSCEVVLMLVLLRVGSCNDVW
jgi:hypothetical protein